MQIVLLGVHGEVVETGGDRVVVVDDLDGVVDDVAGVRHPLPADHELVLGVVAEAVGHAAVPAGDADAARDGSSSPRSCSLLISPIVQIGTIRSVARIVGSSR